MRNLSRAAAVLAVGAALALGAGGVAAADDAGNRTAIDGIDVDKVANGSLNDVADVENVEVNVLSVDDALKYADVLNGVSVLSLFPAE